jgi:PucR C-terminal helix-turn-helix domain
MATRSSRIPGVTARATSARGDPRGTDQLEPVKGGPEPLDPVAALVRLAVDDDDAEGLIANAAAELGRPLGLVTDAGEVLGHAPDDAAGQRALAFAAASVGRTSTIVPPGWRVVVIARAPSRPAALAVGPAGNGAEHDRGALLDLVVALVGEQLVRAALRRRESAAFLRRLVSKPGMGRERAREEASVVGLALADNYWPAVLSWGPTTPGSDAVERVSREAMRLAGGGQTVAVKEHIVLLHPGDGRPATVMAWLEQVVAHARSAVPSSHPQVVTAEAPVALAEIGARVAQLRRLSGYGPRTEAGGPVVQARHYALERLLGDAVAPADARAFVRDLLGGLIAWDRDHRSNLLRVLEAALDCPRHDQAARRCYMHRNTFRLRLRKALLVLGDDLEDPDIRLAIHVALKLRWVTASATTSCSPDARPGEAPDAERRSADAAVVAVPSPSPPR